MRQTARFVDVVKDAGVRAGGDDGNGETTPSADEFVGEFRLDFVFGHARPGEAEGAVKSRRRHLARPANEIHFRLGLDGAQPVQERGEAPVVMQRIAADGGGDKTGVAARHADEGARVFIGVEEDGAALAHQAMEEGGEFRQPVDMLDAGSRLRLLFVEFAAFPASGFGRGFAQEEKFAAFSSSASG